MTDSNKIQEDIQRQFREGQTKLRYYIIALSVAAIGFSINETSEDQIKLIQLPLALSIISWAWSIYFGLKSAKLVLNALFKNNLYFDVDSGRDPLVGTSKSNQEIAKKVIVDNINQMAEKSMFLSKNQERSFAIGVVSFLIWHVLRMFENTL